MTDVVDSMVDLVKRIANVGSNHVFRNEVPYKIINSNSRIFMSQISFLLQILFVK